MGAVLDADVAVLQLLLAEALDGVAQFGLAVGQGVALGGVVGVDGLLHRHGAGHRRLLAEERRPRAERVARRVPQRRQRGRAHAPLRDQPVEGREVLGLLLVHVPQHVAAGAAPEHAELARIDPARAVLAGLVDADHGGHVALGATAYRIAGQVFRPRARGAARDVRGAAVVVGGRAPRALALPVPVHGHDPPRLRPMRPATATMPITAPADTRRL